MWRCHRRSSYPPIVISPIAIVHVPLASLIVTSPSLLSSPGAVSPTISLCFLFISSVIVLWFVSFSVISFNLCLLLVVDI